jgi:hypothetical protein
MRQVLPRERRRAVRQVEANHAGAPAGEPGDLNSRAATHV